jgi:serine/threonine-protein kinase
MDATRWARVQTLFHAAADMPAAEQRRYLESQCDDDPSLVGETLSLLAEDARGGSLLDQGIPAIARDVFTPAGSAPTQSFGPYRLLRMLGEGGMGVVYLGQRDDLGTVAAVKILRDAWLSPARRERFAAEQRTLAQLNHPLIARLYDAGTLADGTPWFVMEYVEGATLTTYCRTQALNMRQRLTLFRSVCEAVQHAHRHLVVHRDLKPSNILVTTDGQIKLLDFGIAKQLEGAGRPAEQTRTALRLLTPAYAAPEQLTGGQIGIHTDVYALGILLYELLAGILPFDRGADGSSPPGDVRVLKRPSLAAKERTSPSATAENARRLSSVEWTDLDVLCLRAMHEDPARRYATVDALIRDVDRFLAGQPLEARPDSLWYRTAKFVRRNRAQVVVGVLATAAVVLLVAFYTVRLASARNEALAEAARTTRIQRFTLGLFEGGDKAAGPADSLHAITLVDRGVQEARMLDGEPAVQAEMYLTLGGIYKKLGVFAKADSLISLALERRRRIFGSAHPDVAEAMIELGLLRIDEARFDDAEKIIRDGLAMAKQTSAPSSPSVVKASAALGRVLTERGAYDKAIPALRDVVRLHETANAPPAELAASISALGDAHFYLGKYEISDSLYRRAMELYRQAFGDRHPLVAEMWANLGAAQFDRGNYKEAERLERQALEIAEPFYGHDHFKTAQYLTMLARALAFENRFDEATDLLGQALVIRERVYGKSHPSVASTVNELGNIALQRERFDEAEAHFRRMIEIYRAAYGEHHYLLGVATSNLGSVLMAKKDYRQAEALYRDAVRRLTEAQGAEHFNTAIARIKLGRSLLRQRRFGEAVVESTAGYDALRKTANPAIGFLQNARKDIAAAYDTLGQGDKAARFKAEFDSTAKASAKK